MVPEEEDWNLAPQQPEFVIPADIVLILVLTEIGFYLYFPSNVYVSKFPPESHHA